VHCAERPLLEANPKKEEDFEYVLLVSSEKWEFLVTYNSPAEARQMQGFQFFVGWRSKTMVSIGRIGSGS
jgi:hypothetical protein